MTDVLPDKCLICHKDLHAYPMGEKEGYKLIACKSCGTVMTNPLVTQAQREAYFGEIDPQITHIPEPSREIERIKKLILKLMPHPAGKRFLDVGCQNGYAVVAAKELGMLSQGIDQHGFFIDFARDKYGANLFEQTTAAEYAAAGHPPVDFLYALECFCMQPDPDNFTAALARLITPKGMIYIEEPDGNHFNLPRKFANWPVVWPPINFIYLSRKGMDALLKRHGLKITKKFFNWLPRMRLVVRKK
jgi:SAM-dependent methyltransferase